LLDGGTPIKFKLAEPVHRFGAVLAELGWLSESQGEHSFANASAQGKLHGEYLVETGALDASIATRGLRTQLIRKLAWANTLASSTVFGLYEGQDFLARWAGSGTAVSPLRAIWQIGRESRGSAYRSTLVARLGQQPLRIHKDSVLEKFGFDSAERALVDVLRARPYSIAELSQLSVLPDNTLHNLVYVLALTRQLDLGNQLRPLGIGVAMESIHELLDCHKVQSSRPLAIGARAIASPEVDPALEEKRRVLLELAQAEETLDYYQLLGIERRASAEEIQLAFFQLAKQFHPDRLGPELSDLRDAGSRVFARLTQAQQTLSDKDRRREYDSQLSLGHASADDEQLRIQAVIQAVTSYQKAEVLLKKRMLAAAELEATHAYEGDPEQPDYLALLAWIRANKQNSDSQLPEILELLNRALQMDPQSEKSHYFRAQVLSRLGKQREALADYRFVVTKNPHHIDAQREIRIWDMRRRDQERTTGVGSSGTRTSSPAPAPSKRASDSKQPARNSATPAPSQGQGAHVVPKTGVFGKFFKR